MIKKAIINIRQVIFIKRNENEKNGVTSIFNYYDIAGNIHYMDVYSRQKEGY